MLDLDFSHEWGMLAISANCPGCSRLYVHDSILAGGAAHGCRGTWFWPKLREPPAAPTGAARTRREHGYDRACFGAALADGSEAVTSAPEEFRYHIATEREKLTRVIKLPGMRGE